MHIMSITWSLAVFYTFAAYYTVNNINHHSYTVPVHACGHFNQQPLYIILDTTIDTYACLLHIFLELIGETIHECKKMFNARTDG